MSSTASRIATWSVIVLAFGVTLAVTYVLVVVVPAQLVPTTAAPPAATTMVTVPVAGPGIEARIRAGAVTVRRALPAAAFALDEGQTLDPRLPAGPFAADLAVTFDPGQVSGARLGAEIVGGELVIERRGRTIARVQAGQEPVTVMSDSMALPGLGTFTYRFAGDGKGPSRLRALWRPERPDYLAAQVDLPLPGHARLDPIDHGLALVQTYHCVACHETDYPELRAGVAPVLGAVGARARPSWLRRWLADPPAMRQGAAMPALLDPVDDAEVLEDIVHFLASMGGPMAEGRTPDPDLVETGRVIFRQVGCTACHGPLDDSPADLDGDWTRLGALSAKTTVDKLAEFLLDPVTQRPAGRMPSLNLSKIEAEAIASYLLSRDLDRHGTVVTELFEPDPERLSRGRVHFAARGCASCHEVEGLPSSLVASPLETADTSAGCLASDPSPGVPRFGFTDAERRTIADFVGRLSSWRVADTPSMHTAATMERLNCLACHGWYGSGGVSPAIDTHFTSLEETDLGDEGRLPPELDDIGAKLNPGWLDAVLTEAGVARPYMSARMPQFGVANVGHLGDGLASAAGVGPVPVAAPRITDDEAEVGRALVGATGLNCIQCHAIADRASTGSPGPDLVQMVERLRYPYFDRWLHDPRVLRPSTRMPKFFYDGVSNLPELGGESSRQIAATWGYLSQGEFLALPEGLAEEADFTLEVDETPVVFRTFMQGVGSRAIACGFPEGVHCAFDADDCRLELVWVGRFLNVAGAWAARGGSFTDPEQTVSWTAPVGHALSAPGGVAMTPRFRGYRLDERGRPVFEYELRAGDTVFTVREQPVPETREGVGVVLVRRFEIEGPPGGRLRQGTEGSIVLLDDNGRGSLSLEVTW